VLSKTRSISCGTNSELQLQQRVHRRIKRIMVYVLRKLMAAIENHDPVALAIVIHLEGTSPAQPGFKLLLRTDGSCSSNVGGARLRRASFKQL